MEPLYELQIDGPCLALILGACSGQSLVDSISENLKLNNNFRERCCIIIT